MIGDKLRTERERQNLTIQDIAKGTSIRALYIEAIEKGEYGQLPGTVYAKGFIRNYANFLKLDADDVVHQFMEENHPEEVAAAEEAKQQIAEAEEQSKAEAKAKLAAAGNEYQENVTTPGNRQNTWLIALIVLLVGAGAYYLFAMEDSSAPKATPKAVTQTAKAPASKEQPVKEDVPKQEAPKKVDGVELVAKFTDKCWTQVVADGKTVYEGTIESGKTETWKGKEKVVITAGNAGAVEMKVNGQDMGKAGDIGQVVEKTFTSDNANKPAPADKKDSKK